MVAVTLLCVFGVGALLAGRVSADDPCLCCSSQVRAPGGTHTHCITMYRLTVSRLLPISTAPT